MRAKRRLQSEIAHEIGEVPQLTELFRGGIERLLAQRLKVVPVEVFKNVLQHGADAQGSVFGLVGSVERRLEFRQRADAKFVVIVEVRQQTGKRRFRPLLGNVFETNRVQDDIQHRAVHLRRRLFVPLLKDGGNLLANALFFGSFHSWNDGLAGNSDWEANGECVSV